MIAAHYRTTPKDARRGGVVLAAPRFDVSHRAFCDALTEQGYEMLALSDADPALAFLALAPPVFLLSLGTSGAVAWPSICSEGGPDWAAACLYDPPLSCLAAGEPRCPTALHLRSSRDDWPSHLEDLAEQRPEVRVFPYVAVEGFALGDSDAARLARLRTLQVFHRASGKGEMGGGG